MVWDFLLAMAFLANVAKLKLGTISKDASNSSIAAS